MHYLRFCLFLSFFIMHQAKKYLNIIALYDIMMNNAF